MSIISIVRDWGMDPSIVRIVTDNTLAEIGAADYLYDQRFIIYDLNGGQFQYNLTDVFLAYATDGWGFFTISEDFHSLTLLISSQSILGFANAPINTNIIQMTGLTSTIAQPTGIADTAGNLVVGFVYDANAVKYISFENAAAGGTPTIKVESGGLDANLIIETEGNANVQIKSQSTDIPLVLWPMSDSSLFVAEFEIDTLSANRIYTFQNKDGTVAFLSDVTAEIDYTVVAGTTQIVAENTKYVAQNGALTTFTIPATFTEGKWFKVVGGKGGGGWKVQQATASHQIKLLAVSSSLGVGGNVVSTDPLDGAEFVCIDGNNVFNMQEVVGNPNLL